MSSGLQSIDARDLAISELFNDFYVVPSYQREYVWKTQQVEQLLADIYYKFTNNDTSDSSEYFIGSIVVLAGTTQTYEIIDGQQRLTSLTFCVKVLTDILAAVSIEQDKKIEMLQKVVNKKD